MRNPPRQNTQVFELLGSLDDLVESSALRDVPGRRKHDCLSIQIDEAGIHLHGHQGSILFFLHRFCHQDARFIPLAEGFAKGEIVAQGAEVLDLHSCQLFVGVLKPLLGGLVGPKDGPVGVD